MDNKSINNEVDQKWLKKHKKELIIGGAVLVGTAGAVITYLLLRKKVVSTAEIVDAIDTFSTESIKPVTDNLIECPGSILPAPRCSHLRKLHEGWHASMEQLKLAESLGVKVPNGCTFVRESPKAIIMPNCA